MSQWCFREVRHCHTEEVFNEKCFMYSYSSWCWTTDILYSLAQSTHQLAVTSITPIRRSSVCKHRFSKWDQYTIINPLVTDLQVRVHKLFTKNDVPPITSNLFLLSLPAAPASYSGLKSSTAWLRSVGVRASASKTRSQRVFAAVEGIFNC